MNRLPANYENHLPKFRSHSQAKEFFIEKFGDDFLLVLDDEVGSEKIYFYFLILDRNAYAKGLKKKQERKWTIVDDDCYNFMFSYQVIEVKEDGSVHIND